MHVRNVFISVECHCLISARNCMRITGFFTRIWVNFKIQSELSKAAHIRLLGYLNWCARNLITFDIRAELFSVSGKKISQIIYLNVSAFHFCLSIIQYFSGDTIYFFDTKVWGSVSKFSVDTQLVNVHFITGILASFIIFYLSLVPQNIYNLKKLF